MNYSYFFHHSGPSLTCIPDSGVPYFHVPHPGLIPGVSKIHEQNELNQDEEESSSRADDKPCYNTSHPDKLIVTGSISDFNIADSKMVLTVGKGLVWNVKGTGCYGHQSSKLKEPKPAEKKSHSSITSIKSKEESAFTENSAESDSNFIISGSVLQTYQTQHIHFPDKVVTLETRFS